MPIQYTETGAFGVADNAAFAGVAVLSALPKKSPFPKGGNKHTHTANL